MPPDGTVKVPGPVTVPEDQVESGDEKDPVTAPPLTRRCGTEPPLPLSEPASTTSLPAPVTLPELTCRVPYSCTFVPEAML